MVGAHPWVYAATQPNYDITPVLPQIFADMAYAGVDGIELMHTALRPEDAVARIQALMQQHTLPVIGASFDGAMWNREQHAAVLADAELIVPKLSRLGGRTVGISVGTIRWGSKERKSAEQPDAQAALLEKIFALCARYGIVPNLHNHTYETIGFVVRHRNEPFYVQAWLLDTHATLNPSDEQMKPYERMSQKSIPHKNAYTIYAAAATDADKQIGRLMQKLDELGLAENTIVIFSSDNGPEDAAIGNAGHSGVGSPGPFRGRKRSLYEGGVRVPFIVRWPGHTPAGKVDNQSVLSGVDLLPTLCSFAGVKLPADLQGDGVNTAAAVEGRSFVRTKPLMWEWRFHIAGHTLNRSPMLAIRDGKWKLLMNSDRSRVELYEIPNDPSEMTNLSEKHPDMVERLAGPLLAWQSSLPKGPVDPGAGSNKYPWPMEQPRVRP